MNNTILLNYYSHRQTNRLHTTKKASAMGRIRTCCYSKLSCTSIFYITLVLLIDSIQCITDGVAPVITPPEPDITVLPSEKVKFTCQSTEPIHWQFHEEYHLNGNQHNIHESYNHGSQYPYESTLEIDQVDYTYVGYYHCVKNLTEAEINEGLDTLVELGLASRIYLFVEDPQHPLAPVTIPVLQGNQHQDIVIPCKPTARNYDVKLIKESDESHQFESTFSPTEGYRIKLNEVTDGGSYTCHSKFDSTGEFDVHFSIHVNCELNKCHGNATIVNDMPATTVVAPISLNQITTISTQHLMTVTTTTTTASNPMVKQIRSGVGKSSFSKRHISSNFSTASVSPPTPATPTVTSSVLQSNQHMSLYDVEITTAPTDSITTTRSDLDDVAIRRYSARRQMPTPSYILEKTKRRAGQTFVNKPNITSKTQNYGIEGGNLELKCSVEVGLGTLIYMYWFLPNNNISLEEGRAIISEPVREKHETHPELSHAVGKLIVHNLDKTKDAGFYKCMVEDSSLNRNSDLINVIKILDPDESFIDINEPTGKYKAEVASTKKEVQWIAKYAGHPIPEIVWRDTRGNEIPWSLSEDKNRKYEAIKDGKSTTLKIRQPKIGDSGFYILRGDNGQKQEERKFQLLVKEKPQLSMEDVSAKPGENAVMKCNIYGYPASSVTWSFIPCSKPEFDSNSCDESKKIKYNETMAVQTLQTHLFNQTSTFTFIPESTGIVICKAKNTEGKTNATAKVIINDLNEELSVWSPNTLPISIGDDVSVVCGASDHKYSQELMWYKDNVPVVNSDNVEVISEETKFSHRREIRWKSIDGSASGQYECRANVIGGTVESKMFELDVVQPQKPEIDPNFKSGGVSKKPVGEPIKLKCQFRGIPTPQLTWYKNGNEIRPDVDDKHITLDDNGTVLHLHYTKAEDEGKYKCVAINRIGSTSHETTLKMTGLPTVSVAFIVSVIAVILVLAICTIYLCIRIRRERRLFRELKAAGLANFEEGNPESINPDLALDEQADLLPYDKKYEFPREKIKLGKQLGAGAFGVVIKGIAQGIVPYEEETTVAVKMVKKMADNEVMRALISELKIMVHLGQHLNVVNLLGAVTKNIAQREVMVIVEYCRFGNLQNFLVKHRRYFIDQIVRDKDIIDPSIQTRDPRWSNDSGYSYFNSLGLKYIQLYFPNKQQQLLKNHYENNNRPDTDRQSVVNSAYIRHSNAGDYFPGGMDSANTEATLLSRNTHPGGEENPAMSDSQPGWRSNYQSDYKGPSRSVTTTDLLCWAFQVARGMEYLASRKVLHGDLAARNILLCDDNVVKICDFGLARSMYKTDNYRKKGEAPLPFKWLALESISDQVFSTYSDVWSFGIVLWELFSLGKVPYPGMDADQALYFKLKDGYRMEKPDFATQDIYDIMLSCWCTNPESRPLFDDLEKSVSKLLENGVAEHYIDLNEPYLKSNVSHFNEGQTDYIALMGAPDCQAPRTPNQYVNSHVITMQDASNAQSQPDYLAMSPPVDVNSPRPDGLDTHDSHFPFAGMNSPTIVNNLNASQSSPKLRNKISNIPEEIPMLKRSNQSFHSDSDSELNTTDVVESIPVTNTPRKNVNVLNTMADNYVNVPSSKVTNNKDAVSNPGYVTVSNINETRT
ncbi:vascular endothelial growth factor receptor 1-like isoform X8 [Sitodiplosis mosellana]|uniref:vascular endothelial growth factor receptor 1-like isoform X8 n=1 Tax=Sitodiplosis mosellana TaxID=263140 RepID=UPI002443AEA0|nr:vascular endothelial growth factor receptor 1-like isoform X8 [Sitodiplosis mosellana]